MAKKTVKEGAAVNGAQKKEQKSVTTAAVTGAKRETAPKITTTKGYVIDRIDVKSDQYYDNQVVLKMEYGKLNFDAKDSKKARENMRVIKAPFYGPAFEQYQKESKENKKEALLNAVRYMFPMFVDDKAFEVTEGVVNGKKVDYINIHKETADDLISEKLKLYNLKPEEKEAKLKSLTDSERSELLKDVKNLVDRWKLTAGVKGDASSRQIAYLTPAEVASRKLRMEVKELSAKGNASKIGKPLTLVALADGVVKRAVAERQERNEKMNKAKSIDWKKYHIPTGANVAITGIVDRNGQKHLYAEVNGVKLGAPLSEEEVTALSSKLATKEQVLMHNKELFGKVLQLNKGNYREAAFAAAVDMIVSRASDAGAKSFTVDQSTAITKVLDKAENKEDALKDLWSKAAARLDDAGVDKGWQESAKAELDDIASGNWKERSQGVSM